MRFSLLVTPAFSASSDQTWTAYDLDRLEHESLIGQQVELLSGRVGTITGFNMENHLYSYTQSLDGATLRLSRSEFNLARIREGARIKLTGLDTVELDGRDEFNGKLGTVLNAEDPKQVRLILDEPALSKKQWGFPEENLEVVGYANLGAMAAAQAVMNKRVRLQTESQYDGLTGEVTLYVPETDEYQVTLDIAVGVLSADKVSGLKLEAMVLLE